MNIIKLKDKVMPDSISGHDYFNKHLKGKYAYWVHMRYAVAFEHMESKAYVACENDINMLLPLPNGGFPEPYGVPCLDTHNDIILTEYVDSDETDRINSITALVLKNEYTPDGDITVDELKLFRSWLAKQLLMMSENILLGSLDKHVLEYYANDMYDNTIKVLSDFGTSKATIDKVNTACACHGSNLSTLYDLSVNACNPIEVYKNNLYLKMVEMFSSYTFWTQWSHEFINEFKKYIDNIVKCNFPLSSTQWLQELADCGCRDKTEQDKYIEILKRLSTALGYIRDEKVIGNKNFINDALYDWASLLYEKMSW